MPESHYRSFLKSLSWRLWATLDTMVVSWFIIGSGGHLQALSIGVSELFTKMLLYYGHERLWIYLMDSRKWSQTPKISLIKAITWRITGSIDTFILASLITGSGIMGLKISSTELLTKIVLYYFHERAWMKLPLGTVRRWFGKK